MTIIKSNTKTYECPVCHAVTVYWESNDIFPPHCANEECRLNKALHMACVAFDEQMEKVK